MSGIGLLFLLMASGGVGGEGVPGNEPAMEIASTTPLEPGDEGGATAAGIWLSEIGRGFAKNVRSIEVNVARAFGSTEFGSKVPHDLWLAQVQGGWMLTDVMEPEYWFGGNLEGVGQLLAGRQDNPEAGTFVGLNAGLRYHFRTGTRVDPFIAGFFGLALTDIGTPDLSGTFQFNESIGAGARYFFSRNYALNLEYALWHVSNGGRRDPNSGLTSHRVSVGLGWLF